MLTAKQRLAGLTPAFAKRLATIEQALEQGRVVHAERDLIAVMALAPSHPEVLRLLGVIQFLRGRKREAIDTLLQAAAQQPQDARIHATLGDVYAALPDHRRAAAAYRRACETDPEASVCWFNLGRMHYTLGELDAATAAIERAVALAPRHTSSRVMLGELLVANGRVGEAEQQLRTVLAQRASAGYAWWGLAAVCQVPLDADDVKRMRQALHDPAQRDFERVATNFALAHALEQADDYAGAFAALAQVHVLARRMAAHDRAGFSAHVTQVLDAFATPRATPPQGAETIFITSLPRSGSTLVEQILASHSQVQGTTELPQLRQIIGEASERQRAPFPQWADRLGANDWAALGRQYLERTAQWRRERPCFTDKMPGNWLYAGAILSMLPDARVIIVRRDPLETCLACYRFLFNGHAYTHDFDDLAAQWRDFDRAARHWRAVYPGRVYELVYEQLLADPETEIRKLLAFCGLPFEEACVNFHTTTRRVTTPSAGQVREPIRRDTARAAKYGALLDPLRAALNLAPFASR